MRVVQRAVVRISLGQRRDDDLRQGVIEVVLVGAFGFIRPENDRGMTGFVDRRGHDLRDHDRAEVVSLRDLGRIARVGGTLIGESTCQRRMHVIILIGRDDVIRSLGVVRQVGRQLLQRRVVGCLDIRRAAVGRIHRAAIGRREEQLPRVLAGEVELMAAVIGIRITRTGAAEADQGNGVLRGLGEVVRERTAGRVEVLAVGVQHIHSLGVGFPGNAGALEQSAEIFHVVAGARHIVVDLVHAIGRTVGIVVIQLALVASVLHPDILGLGRMDAGAGAVIDRDIVMIARSIRDLRGVRVARGDQAVDVRRRRTSHDLLAATGFVGGEVAVFEENIEHGGDLRVSRGQRQAGGAGKGEQALLKQSQMGSIGYLIHHNNVNSYGFNLGLGVSWFSYKCC